MKTSVRRKDEHTTAAWSGGSTTELFLYPEGASYKNMDFLFRLSSATVEVPESVFTSLPGVSRVLMVLEGNIALGSGSDEAVAIGPYDQHAFSGDEQTLCKGMCTDFNLMMRHCTGGLESVLLLPGERKNFAVQCQRGIRHTAVYSIDGTVACAPDSQNFCLSPQDLVYFCIDGDEKIANLCLENRTREKAHLVIATVDTPY